MCAIIAGLFGAGKWTQSLSMLGKHSTNQATAAASWNLVFYLLKAQMCPLGSCPADTALLISSCKGWYGGFPLILFLPIFSFQHFVELANTAERSQAKEGSPREQDRLSQFGAPKESLRQQIHRMFLLRVKLMHFVNSLHNYIMTRVGVCPSPRFFCPM